MKYIGIIITGTSGSGKSTVVQGICKKSDDFQIVQSVTTRKHRKDDLDGQYDYISQEKFKELKDNNELIVDSEYREDYYGISHKTFYETLQANKIPLIVITPSSVADIISKISNEFEDKKFLSFFIDSKDESLDDRLEKRDRITEGLKDQRQVDRKFRNECLYNVKNIEVEKTVELILSLWEYRNGSGVLPKRLIKLLIECGMLLENVDTLENIKGASYDLSLGDEYYYGGKIRTLTDNEPFISIEPYDYAIVTCNEITNFPRDIVGRFDLSVSLFCQGIILSNGPQVDPGFKGRLFCLLFNTSNGLVFLKRGQHYATLEFSKLIEPTEPYDGQYQFKGKMLHYLPSNMMRGAINELKKEIESVKRENRSLYEITMAVTSLILAVIAILLASK
jgi:deoxycytidine triphosphate deaminase